jgi:hypothetical protein
MPSDAVFPNDTRSGDRTRKPVRARDFKTDPGTIQGNNIAAAPCGPLSEIVRAGSPESALMTANLTTIALTENPGKRCSRCGEMKALSAFSRRRGTQYQSACKACATANLREWTAQDGNRERLYQSITASKSRHVEHVKARRAVATALQAGRLTRGACEDAGDCAGPVQAHHDDYAKPLEVRWLCRRHHEALNHARAAA